MDTVYYKHVGVVWDSGHHVEFCHVHAPKTWCNIQNGLNMYQLIYVTLNIHCLTNTQKDIYASDVRVKSTIDMLREYIIIFLNMNKYLLQKTNFFW